MKVFSQLFGPSKEEIWRELANQVGGNFTYGGLWLPDKVEAHYKDWSIVLDTKIISTGKTTLVYTRMRAPFSNADGFRFCLRRKQIFHNLGHFFGMQDIEIGNPEFDRAFIIQGNDPEKVRQLFSNETIRQLIQRLPRIRLQIEPPRPGLFKQAASGTNSLLYFKALGVIKDLERLKLLYALFAETLNQLCLMESSYAPELNQQV